MRAAAFAGRFYEKGEMTLQQQLKTCFESERGPGATPNPKKTAKMPKAIVAPHAGYEFSGPCAAWSYKAIGDAPQADVYFVIAPSHRGGAGLTQEPFTTPLGIIRVDQDISRRLLEKGSIEENNSAFDEEHSVEVQLPMLQYAHFEKRETLKIVPILLNYDVDLQQLSADIKEVLVDTGKTAVFIVSTDFTHYGRQYKYIPFSENVPEKLAALDKGAIDLVMQGKHEELIAYVDEHMATICGVQGLALLGRLIKSTDARLEQYYTSSAITGDKHNSVSYASIVFY